MAGRSKRHHADRREGLFTRIVRVVAGGIHVGTGSGEASTVRSIAVPVRNRMRKIFLALAAAEKQYT